MFGDRMQLFRLVDLVNGLSGHIVGSKGGMVLRLCGIMGRRVQIIC